MVAQQVGDPTQANSTALLTRTSHVMVASCLPLLRLTYRQRLKLN